MNTKHLLEIINNSCLLGTKYHAFKTGLIPNITSVVDYDTSKWNEFLHYTTTTYEWKKEDRIQFDRLNADGEKITRWLLHLQANITVFNPSHNRSELLYDSSSNQKAVKDLLSKFQAIAPHESNNGIGLIRDGGGYLEIKSFEYSLPDHSLIKYLNGSTQVFYQNIISQLESQNGSGLYLLYGKPGTGKTSFIKNVLSKTSKRALFISPAFTEELTSPRLISLLMDYPDSILVIEDAESVIMERQADNSSAVSNLLNLTDGFLADFLNLKIICTFNTKLGNIDEALLRDGRLKGMHEFKEIKADKARQIAVLLDRDISPDKPMTLAEICNSTINSREYRSRSIGFAG